MIKLENTEVMGWEAAIRGMRNPMNSWKKSDSKMIGQVLKGEEIAPGVDRSYWEPCEPYISIGENDHALMQKLANAGPVHGKFRRMITVYVDITAPLYFWKEFDTYKVGTVANSCSTMHKIADHTFTYNDFSYDHLFGEAHSVLGDVIDVLNYFRRLYLDTKANLKKAHSPDEKKRLQDLSKQAWWQMIQLLPSSYNQRRTVMLNYEVLANIYKYRKDHKLNEWRELCEWIEQLPYSELIAGKEE